MILGCCVVTLASHDSLTLFANSLVFIGFHLLLSGSQPTLFRVISVGCLGRFWEYWSYLGLILPKS